MAREKLVATVTVRGTELDLLQVLTSVSGDLIKSLNTGLVPIIL